MKQADYTSRVVARRDVAPGVRELVLSPPDPPLDFRPGQWISLHLPVGEHPPLVRAYSLAAPPVPSGELILCFDRVPDGLGSGYLFTLEPGDEVRYSGPLGNFVLPETDRPLLWLARYTGIVPFRAMALHLRAHPPAQPVTLLYSAERPQDLAYLDELRELAEACPWFELRAMIDRTEPGWGGEVGAVLDALPALLEGREPVVPMVCGKREFVRPIRDFFYGRGYERRAVRWENYD